MKTTRNLFELWILTNVSAIVSATVTITSLRCKFNTDLIANGNCEILTAKSGTTYLTGGVTFLLPTDDVWITLKFLRKVKGNYEIFGVTFTQNFCDHKKGASMNVFLKRIFLNGMKQIKNLNCPLLGNVSVSRYRYQMPVAQGFMPPSDYLLNFYMSRTRQKIYILDGNVSFTVTAVV